MKHGEDLRFASQLDRMSPGSGRARREARARAPGIPQARPGPRSGSAPVGEAPPMPRPQRHRPAGLRGVFRASLSKPRPRPAPASKSPLPSATARLGHAHSTATPRPRRWRPRRSDAAAQRPRPQIRPRPSAPESRPRDTPRPGFRSGPHRGPAPCLARPRPSPARRPPVAARIDFRGGAEVRAASVFRGLDPAPAASVPPQVPCLSVPARLQDTGEPGTAAERGEGREDGGSDPLGVPGSWSLPSSPCAGSTVGPASGSGGDPSCCWR